MKDQDSHHFTEENQPYLSRREFIKLSGAAGAGALLSLYGLPEHSPAVSCHLPVEFPTPSQHKNVIIIGSGFGGAITALRLSEQGIPTTIIEKGRRWAIGPDGNTFSPYFYPDGRSTWLSNFTVVPIGPRLPIDKYVGVLEGHFYRGLRVLAGACYGGGSIVYGGLHVKPPEELFTRVFPPELDYQELETYYQRVASTLGIGPVPDDIYQTEFFTHYRVMEEQSATAGLKTVRIESASDWDTVRKEIDGTIQPSGIHGEAIYGVNSGAKKSLDTNYLFQAEGTGHLEVKTLHRVKEIGIASDNTYLVLTEEINEQGHVLNTKVYSCDYLFLAAGSIGTTNLLVKAKAKALLPDLNEHIGDGWGNNGNVEVLRTNTGALTGKWQGGPPAAAIEDYENPIAPLFIEHPQFPLGIECGCLLYFGIGIHTTRGKFIYNPIFDKACLSWPKNHNEQELVNSALLHTMEKLNNANGGRLSPLIGGLEKYNDQAVYHPLGGAVMGQACDYFGRVKNYERLYVNDSALIPGSTASANPAFTVAAIAERNIERILEDDF